MKKLYTDASFDWTSTEKAENVVRGKIAISDGDGFERIDKVAIGKVEGLKQYINILELTAVARAVELASEHFKEEAKGLLEVWTDSQVAMSWANNAKINQKIAKLAHYNALEYLRKAQILFGGIVSFHYIKRDQNPAGHLLEQELKKEAPHTI